MNEVVSLKQILDLDNKLGQGVTELLNKDEDNPKLSSSYDLLLKIQSNIYSLLKLVDNKECQTAINVLYRTIFSDLMVLAFLNSLTDDDAKKAIRYFDYKHIKSVLEGITLRYELAEEVYKNDAHKIKQEKDLIVARYQKNFPDLFSKDKEGNYRVIKPQGGINAMSAFGGQLKQIFDYFTKNEHLTQYRYLYQYYKILSQSEHYSPIGRGFNFYSNSDKNLENEYKANIYVALYNIGLKLGISLDRQIQVVPKFYQQQK